MDTGRATDGHLGAYVVPIDTTCRIWETSRQVATNAKRAIARLIADVFRDLCGSGRWSGARPAGPADPD